MSKKFTLVSLVILLSSLNACVGYSNTESTVDDLFGFMLDEYLVTQTFDFDFENEQRC